MKLKRIFHRAATGALCLILCVCALTQTALAKTPERPIPDGYFGTNPKTCTLTLNNYPHQGMTVKLYRIADVSQDVKFTATKNFEKILKDLDNGKYQNFNISSQAEWTALANGLDSVLAGVSPVKPTKTGTTDKNGSVKFTGLQRGLYLIVNDIHVTTKTVNGVTAEYRVDSAPMLVCLPNWVEQKNPDGTSVEDWSNNVEIAVKTSEYLNEKFPLTVIKIWLAADGKPLTSGGHPKWIEVELYQDNRLYGSQILDQNKWSCTWEDLPPGHKYWIREIMPDGTEQKYNVEITQVGGGALNEDGVLVQAVTIRLVNREKPTTPPPNPPGTNPPGTNPPGTNPPGTNPPGTNPPGTNPPGTNPPTPPVEIDDPDIPLGNLPSTDPNDPPEEIEIDDPDIPLGDIPQTGQLWWPVPLMAVAGLFLVLIGFVRRRGGEYDEE